MMATGQAMMATVKPWALPLAIGAGVAVLSGGPVGLATGAGSAVGAWWWLRRQPSTVDPAEARVAGELPYAIDLLSVVVQAGLPPDAAAGAVARALGGPVGDRLTLVARSLRLGADAAEAWAYLGSGPAAARVVQVAVSSERSGAALSGSLARLADDLREDRSQAAEARAQRAGVLVVLPLGMCFLPAFVLVGVVPIVVALVGHYLST